MDSVKMDSIKMGSVKMSSTTERENSTVIFREVQKMNQLWVRIVIAITVVMTWYGAYQQLLLRKPFGNNPAPDWIMILVFIMFGVLFPVFFRSIKLVTEVRKSGLYVRFYPLHFSFKSIPFETIQSYDVRTYNPLRDYGGWGIRYGSKGKAYTVEGSRGVFFEFLEGGKVKKLMIGSQIPEKLSEAVRRGIRNQN
jgi:hypothetical protein